MDHDNYIFTVGTLNTYIKELLDADAGLAAVTVQGEISNYKAYPSGHHYFSLKDETGTLKCVMFKGNAARIRFQPQNGMAVVAMGRVGVYERDGVYQLYVNAMLPDGEGALNAAFEQMKARLQAEGLFDERHKKPIPAYPTKIALVTSPAGDAVQDMLRNLKARWPMTQVVILPVLVQGDEAAEQISRAIDYANAVQIADLIITGRGGGSAEDLWAFNEEPVARAIYRSEIPVISAVGHEPDVSISDYVADLRAGTPTKAAVAAVPDQKDVYAWLEQSEMRMTQRLGRELALARESLRRFVQSRALSDPMNIVKDRRIQLERASQRMTAALQGRLIQEKKRFAVSAAKLDALSPLKVLGRGYAIPQAGERVLLTVDELRKQDRFTLRLRDGIVPCQVEKG